MGKKTDRSDNAAGRLSPIDVQVIEELREDGGDLLSELVEMFIIEVPLQLDALEAALRKPDAGAARLAAHTLKGTASNFGAAQMRMLASSLEEKARNATLDGWPAICAELRAESARVRQALESLIS